MMDCMTLVRRCVAVLSLSFGAAVGGAQASPLTTTEDLGELAFGDATGIFNVYNDDKGLFEDSYTFTLANDGAVEVRITEESFISFLDFAIEGLSGTIDGQGGSGTAFIVNGLEADTQYTLKITGNITGDDGGSYAGLVTAVPLPAAAWLFGTALLGGAVVARRKQQSLAGALAA